MSVQLDYKVDEKKLQEVFSSAGKVVRAKLFRKDNGNFYNYGMVEFEHPLEAVQAICILLLFINRNTTTKN